jgi:16S rRNA (adenine1518-N6/adenine1519-N6)-dimethyltransferase
MMTPREILKQYDIQPTKRLGQSFLIDVNVIHKIAAAACTAPGDVVVEIGAGIGVLTASLAQRASRLIAVELDTRLVKILQDRFGTNPVVQIHAGDVLKFDFSLISDKYNSKVKVIGNVPYNISSPVIFHLMKHRTVINNFTLMLQKEVVERLVAVPGTKSYGVPSVLLQIYVDVERLFDVAPSCFYPRPKVVSSVMQGFFRKQPLFELEDEELFVKLVRSAFARRRKMLLNNLKNASFLESLPEQLIKEALIQTGIDPTRRGETLSPEDFANLANNLKYRLTNN